MENGNDWNEAGSDHGVEIVEGDQEVGTLSLELAPWDSWTPHHTRGQAGYTLRGRGTRDHTCQEPQSHVSAEQIVWIQV